MTYIPGTGQGASRATSTTLGTVKIQGTPTDANYPVAYVKEQTDTLLSGKSDTGHSHTFASLSSKPTTISGYGIADAVLIGDSRLSDARTPLTHTHAATDIGSGIFAIARIPTGQTATTPALGIRSTTPTVAYATAFLTAAAVANGSIWVRAIITAGANGVIRFGVATGASAAGNLLADSHVMATLV